METVMKYLTVLAVFVCIFYCANAQNFIQHIHEEPEVPTTEIIHEEGTEKPDINDLEDSEGEKDENASEENEDEGDIDDEEDYDKDDDEYDEDEEEDMEPEMDDDDDDENEEDVYDDSDDVNDDVDDDVDDDDDDDGDVDDDDDDADDNVGDDNDIDDDYKRHHHGRRGNCLRRCKKVAMQCRKRGGRLRCHKVFVMCMRKCSGKGHHPFSPPKYIMCSRKCIFGLLKCLKTNSTKDECLEKLKDCFHECKNCSSSKNAFPAKECVKNCREKMFSCFMNGTKGSFECMRQMEVCAMKCKRDLGPRNHTVSFRECVGRCMVRLSECFRNRSSNPRACFARKKSCIYRCKKFKLPQINLGKILPKVYPQRRRPLIPMKILPLTHEMQTRARYRNLFQRLRNGRLGNKRLGIGRLGYKRFGYGRLGYGHRFGKV